MKLKTLGGIAAIIAGIGTYYANSQGLKAQADKIAESGNIKLTELLNVKEPSDETFMVNLENIAASSKELEELSKIKLHASDIGEEKSPEEFLERVVFLLLLLLVFSKYSLNSLQNFWLRKANFRFPSVNILRYL